MLSRSRKKKKTGETFRGQASLLGEFGKEAVGGIKVGVTGPYRAHFDFSAGGAGNRSWRPRNHCWHQVR